MRSKLIITGAIAVLAAATLTVNAENSAQKTNAARTASAVALFARTVSADREEVAIDVPAATTTVTTTAAAKPDIEQSSKPDTDSKPAATPALPAACTDAIANLKSMHQADVSEDATERTNAATESAATIAADKSEDMTEGQSWTKALMAAHTACEPQPLVGCQTALSGLQTVLASLRTQELAEPSGSAMDFAADFAPVHTAFSAIAMACANRE